LIIWSRVGVIKGDTKLNTLNMCGCEIIELW
jgi:hypothetical protein